ncbi:MAG: hypothetical protein GY857_03725, partial [Desulfobacula sp.]|nr:hypothetical protein [Desulfobacula sp.]
GNGISDTKSRDKWEAEGGLTTWQRANEKARKILSGSRPPKLAKTLEKSMREKFNLFLEP